jgi:hypothetical protein
METTNKIKYYTAEFEKHYNNQKKSQNPNPNVAICIMGQLRSFFDEEIHNSIFELIENFNERYGEVVCFFFVNDEISFKGSEWKSDDELNRLVTKCGEVDRREFELLVEKNMNCSYNVQYYTDDFFDDIPTPRVYENLTYAYQRKLMRECAVMISDYEKKTNIKFDVVVKQRPDKRIYVNKIRWNGRFYNYKDTIISSYLDFFRVYPRFVFNFLIENMESFATWLREKETFEIVSSDGRIIDFTEGGLWESLDLNMIKLLKLKKKIHVQFVKKLI